MAKTTRKQAAAPTSNLVNFRLAPTLIKQLDALALRNDESRGGYAAYLVTKALTESWKDDLDQRLKETDGRVDELRHDLATMVLAMLVTFAKEDPDKAKRWVDANLFKL